MKALSGYRKLLFLVTILGLILVLAGFFNLKPASGQQGGSIQWSRETVLANLTGVPMQTFFPVIAADPYGSVHVFWTQGTSIYYMRKDNTGWTSPVDVVWTGERTILSPSVAIDHQGTIHLIWQTFGEIYHKTVPAWEADDVHKWSDNVLIGQYGGSSQPIRIAVDPQNHLHIVFTDWNGRAGKTRGGNVYHFQSDDGGLTWSDFEQVSFVPDGELATDPRMAFDPEGRVHIVWGEMDPSLEGLQQGVFYSRLSPQGLAEIPPVQIAEREPNDKWLMAINVAVVGKEVNTVWVCGDQAKRCHAWSNDGGDTWTKPERVFENLIGLSGWDALLVDGSGSLYWLTVLRYPQAMHYSFWQGTRWQDPPLIASTDENMKLGENVMAAIALGNRIYVVIQLGDVISFMEGETNATGEPPQPVPTTFITSTPGNTPEPAGLLDPAATPVPQSQMPTPGLVTTRTSISSLGILGVSILPVVLFVFIIGAIRVYRRR